MQEIIETRLSEIIARIIDDFIDEKTDCECSNCGYAINQIIFKDIVSWLKGEK